MQHRRLTQSAIDNTSLEVYWADTRGRFVDANAAACEALGYSRDELLGMNVADIDTCLPAPQWREFLGRLRSEGNKTLEAVHRRKDGSQYPVEVHVTLLQIDGEELICGFARDISERARVRSAPGHRQAYYSSVIEATPLLICSFFTDGTIYFVNQAFCRFHAKTAEELSGSDFFSLLPPVGREHLQSKVEALSAATTSTTHDQSTSTPDGEVNWQRWTIRALIDGDADVWAYQALGEDITEHQRAKQAVQESTDRYRSIIETALDGFWMVDMEAKLLEVNDSYCRLSGYSREELVGRHIYDVEAQETRRGIADRVDTIAQQGSGLFETWHRRSNGDTWPVEVAVSYSPVEGGRFFVFLRDIRERKLAEELGDLRQRLSEIVYQGNLDTLMQTALDAAEALTSSSIGFFHFVEQDQENLSLQVWSSRTLREMCFAEGKGLHYPVNDAGVWVDCIHQRRAVTHNDYPSLSHKKGMPEGHPHLARELTVPVFREGLIVAVMGVGNKETDYSRYDTDIVTRVADMAFDFVERKRAEQNIEYMAYYDTLTGLPNRVLLSDRLNQAMAHHRRNGRLLAVCYLDLDGFKPVNDKYGHDVGDALLVGLGKRLQSLLRDGDTLARLSGDEFVILLSELASDRDGEAIVRRILNSIEQPFEVKGHGIGISGSIGITLFPTDDVSADTLLRHADQAMYQAKATSAGAFKIYDAVQDAQLRVQRDMLLEVQHGLEQREFVLYYQPRVELRSGRVVGVEALVRWLHPERGLLMPGSFLPHMEGEPQEIALGEWVVGEALAQYERWRQAGLHLPVSVNISPNHLQAEGFVDFLSRALAAYPRGTADNLELEILETSAIGDTAAVASIMQACADLGVSFSLDDFGTGYSSLTYFHRLPIHVLKIDRNFVRNMMTDVSDMDIVEGVLRLADALRRPVVAEGVESVELGFLLLYLGCRYAQGYGISRPIPPDQLPRWLEQWSEDNLWRQLQSEDTERTEDFELKVAMFSHKRWVEKVTEHVLSSGKVRPPPLNADSCQFSRWYNGLGRSRYGDRPDYAFILPKHTRVHDQAGMVVGLIESGNMQQAAAGLEELERLSVDLAQLMARLLVKKP
jgi:diguanylate cyclase (GGDEF)-like protein/PAS domain S-box-containing protein